jgi:YbgC/YbaW family acyl-CoA thioester hydrolase
MALEQQLLFTVVSLETHFHSPARLDDALRVHSTAAIAGGASVLFTQQLWRDAGTPVLLASATVRVACLQPGTFRPRRLPDALRKEFS